MSFCFEYVSNQLRIKYSVLREARNLSLWLGDHKAIKYFNKLKSIYNILTYTSATQKRKRKNLERFMTGCCTL
jgi:hypothetical protein